MVKMVPVLVGVDEGERVGLTGGVGDEVGVLLGVGVKVGAVQ